MTVQLKFGFTFVLACVMACTLPLPARTELRDGERRKKRGRTV
jgi:hypothetical protein